MYIYLNDKIEPGAAGASPLRVSLNSALGRLRGLRCHRARDQRLQQLLRIRNIITSVHLCLDNI